MSGIPLLSVASAAMAAERDALDVEAHNVAAAQASSPTHEYRRLVAHFAVASAPISGGFVPDAFDGGDATEEPDASDMPDDEPPAVRFTGAVASRDPADTMTELIAVLDAERGYEAGASVFDAGKRLVERALDVERS